MYPVEFKYTKSHEWLKVQGKKAKVGITSFAIESLTDLTFLQINVEVGDTLKKGDSFGDVESVKTASQIYTPVSGKVTAVHKDLSDKLEELMKDPFEKGWMIEVEMSQPEEANALFSAKQYEDVVAAEGHH